MLKCKEVAENATDYIEGSLTGKHWLSWKMHLLLCRHCRRFIRYLILSSNLGASVASPSNISQKETKDLCEHILNHSDSDKEKP